jgi:O-antigen/teichoic acid export membrane protein
MKRLVALARSGSLKGQLLRGGFLGLAVRVMAVLAAFLASVLLARLMGAADFGSYAFILSLGALLALPVQAGLPTLVLRETAKAEAAQDWPAMRGIWSWAIGIICLMSAVVAAGGLIVFVFPVVLFTEDMRWSVLLATLLVLPLALNGFGAASLRGLRRIFTAQFPGEVLRPLLLMGLATAVAFTPFLPLDPTAAFLCYMTASVLAFAVAAVLLWRAIPDGIFEEWAAKFEHRIWLRSLFPLSIMSGLLVINQNTDIMMLGMFRPSEDVGLYKVAVSAAALLVFGLSAVQMICMPYVVRFHAQGDRRRLQSLSLMASLGSLGLTLPLFAAFFFWGEEILSVVYGDAFRAAASALKIICFAQVVNSFFGIVWPLLVMTGHERSGMWGLLVASLVNVGLNVLLIPPYGIEGAAVGTGASIIVWNVLFWISALRRLGVDCSPLALLRR